MTEPIKKDIQRHVCECCFLVFEAPEKKPYCPFCEINFDMLNESSIGRLSRMIAIMSKASIAGLPLIIQMLWDQMWPLIEANNDRS